MMYDEEKGESADVETKEAQEGQIEVKDVSSMDGTSANMATSTSAGDHSTGAAPQNVNAPTKVAGC